LELGVRPREGMINDGDLIIERVAVGLVEIKPLPDDGLVVLVKWDAGRVISPRAPEVSGTISGALSSWSIRCGTRGGTIAISPLLNKVEVPVYLGCDWQNVPLHLPSTFPAFRELTNSQHVQVAMLGEHGLAWPWESLHIEALAWFDHWLKK
jgi:hypothetical protein